MIAGAIAFFLYALTVSKVMMRYKPPALAATSTLILIMASRCLWALVCLGAIGRIYENRTQCFLYAAHSLEGLCADFLHPSPLRGDPTAPRCMAAKYSKISGDNFSNSDQGSLNAQHNSARSEFTPLAYVHCRLTKPGRSQFRISS